MTVITVNESHSVQGQSLSSQAGRAYGGDLRLRFLWRRFVSEIKGEEVACVTGGDDGLVTPTPMAALLGSPHSQDSPSCGKKLQVRGGGGGRGQRVAMVAGRVERIPGE